MHAELPEGWKSGLLGDVVGINRCHWSPSSDTSILYLDLTAVAPGKLSPPKALSNRSAPSRARRKVHSGDVLVSTVRPNLRGFARVRQAPENLVASTGFAVLTPVTTVNGSFIYQLVMTRHFARYLEKAATGQAYPAVRPSDIEAFEIALPPLPEQRDIAAVLDSIDETIERTEAAITATEKLRDAMRHELLTRGLPGWHSSWKEVRRFGVIPADWKVVRLGEVAEVVMGQSPPGNTVFEWEGETFLDSGLPFVQGNAEFGSKFPQPLKWCAKPARVADSDAFLISVRAPVGHTNRVDQRLAIGRGLAAIWFTGVNRSYGWHAINQAKHALQPISQGSTFRAIGGKDLRSLMLPHPSLSEQQAIARVLDSLDNALETSQRLNNALHQMKVSTAEALLTGQARVSEEVGVSR